MSERAELFREHGRLVDASSDRALTDEEHARLLAVRKRLDELDPLNTILDKHFAELDAAEADVDAAEAEFEKFLSDRTKKSDDPR